MLNDQPQITEIRLTPLSLFMQLNYVSGEYDHAFNLSHPKIVFTSQYAAEKVLNIAKNNASIVKKVVFFGVQKRDDKLSVGYNNFITNPKVINDHWIMLN